jgi:hypothetical protein
MPRPNDTVGSSLISHTERPRTRQGPLEFEQFSPGTTQLDVHAATNVCAPGEADRIGSSGARQTSADAIVELEAGSPRKIAHDFCARRASRGLHRKLSADAESARFLRFGATVAISVSGDLRPLLGLVRLP